MKQGTSMQFGRMRWLGLSAITILVDQVVKAVIVAKFELFEQIGRAHV